MIVEVKKHACTVPVNIKRMNVQVQKVNTNASTVSPIIDSTRKER
jgi:hypothetical protein